MSVSQRGIKKEILALLEDGDIAAIQQGLVRYPPAKLLNSLFSAICSASAQIRWNGIMAMGATVARLADQEMEAARIVMRRFMWSLNDESGGIGWGAPEAMAECLARHQDLAQEYTKILVSFMREDGFYLELPSLQRGLMWGLARLAEVQPDLLRTWQAPRCLLPYLASEDAAVRGLAALALGRLQATEAAEQIAKLASDPAPFSLYRNSTLSNTPVAQLAQEALTLLASPAS
jgi:hypothetical protein